MRQKQKRSSLHKVAIFSVALLFLYGGYYFGNKLGTESVHFKTLLADENPSTLVVPELLTHTNDRFSTTHLKKRWSLVFLGGTNEVSDSKALLTLSAQIRNRLASHPDLQQLFQVIVVSPLSTDTPESMKPLVYGYGKDFIGISGKEESVTKLANQLGLKFSSVEIDGETVMRSSSIIVLLDPEARKTGLFAGKVTPSDMAEDIILASEKYQSRD